MKVVPFPVYRFDDPRSFSIRLDAERYGRVVKFDTKRCVARLGREHDAEWYASKAEVVRFPIERTLYRGEL